MPSPPTPHTSLVSPLNPQPPPLAPKSSPLNPHPSTHTPRTNLYHPETYLSGDNAWKRQRQHPYTYIKAKPEQPSWHSHYGNVSDPLFRIHEAMGMLLQNEWVG